jgi:hypothetical protein
MGDQMKTASFALATARWAAHPSDISYVETFTSIQFIQSFIEKRFSLFCPVPRLLVGLLKFTTFAGVLF